MLSAWMSTNMTKPNSLEEYYSDANDWLFEKHHLFTPEKALSIETFNQKMNAKLPDAAIMVYAATCWANLVNEVNWKLTPYHIGWRDNLTFTGEIAKQSER